MINIQPVENAETYTLGTWTSPLMINSTAGFPSGVSSEWGYLSWIEENTGTGYTGYVRIDILDSSDNVLIADIAKNTNGSPTYLYSTSVAFTDIKIKVKLYGGDSPTPKVSGLWLNYNNWNNEQVVTLNGKNISLNRSLIASPTMTNLSKLRFGNGQVSAFDESSTDLTNGLSTWTVPDTITYDTDNSRVILQYTINVGEVYMTNGTTFGAIGISNTDVSGYFIAGSRFIDITKNPLLNYKIRVSFKIVDAPMSTFVTTIAGRNLMIDRIMKLSPTYSAVSKFSLGYTGALSDDMTALDSEYVGPSTFVYTNFDTATPKTITRAYMDQLTGNGNTFNAIIHRNTDGSPIANYVVKLYESILKTSNYIYNFDTSYKPLTPSNIIG